MRSRFAAIVLAIILAVVAASLVGCGGGAAVEEPQDVGQTSAAPAAPAAVTQPDAAPVDRSPEETSAYTPFPTDPNVTPKAVLELIEAKQPMMVFFYDSTQKTTNDQTKGISGKSGIEKLMSEYRGTIDLVSYDIGRFVATAADESISIDPKFAETTSAQQAVSLASTLGVKFTPYIMIVDANGYIIARFRGWDDYKDIEREVLRATS